MSSGQDNRNVNNKWKEQSQKKNDFFSLNQIFKKHKSQDVYFKQSSPTVKKTKTTHSKEALNTIGKKSEVAPMLKLSQSPKKQVTTSSKNSPRVMEEISQLNLNERNTENTTEAIRKQTSWERIMSDNDSFQEIDSDEDGKNSYNPKLSDRDNSIIDCVDETETSEINTDYPGVVKQVNNKNVPSIITTHINKFPTLSTNPFTINEGEDNFGNCKTDINYRNKDNDRRRKSNNNNSKYNQQAVKAQVKRVVLDILEDDSPLNINQEMESSQPHLKEELDKKPPNQDVHVYTANPSNSDNIQLYRSLLTLSKKGDRETFLVTLEKVLSTQSSQINYKDENGYTAWHYACDEGNLKIVEMWIKSNCDWNIKTNDKKTPLHLCVMHGYFDITKLLIENGATWNVGDNEKNTPIHLCAIHGHWELLKFLLDKLPSANNKNIYGKTPLSWASSSEWKEVLTAYLTKKDGIYHNIKIQTASDSTMNKMMNQFKNETSGIMFHNEQHNININIQTNINHGNNSNKSTNHKGNKILFSNKTNTSKQKDFEFKKPFLTISEGKFRHNNSTHRIGWKQSGRSKQELNTNLVKRLNTSGNTQSGFNKPKANLNINVNTNNVSNISNPRSTTNKQKNLNDSSAQFHKTKTWQKFTTSKFDTNGRSNKSPDMKNTTTLNSGTKLKASENAIQSSLNNTTDAVTYKLNKTEDYSQNFKTNQHEITTDDNIYNQLSLNSIEEERITPTSFVYLGSLGRGSFGDVYLVQKINSKSWYAMKVLSKDRIMGHNWMKYAMAERNVLSLTNHPFIVKLNYAFQTSSKLFLILDYCPWGDLSKHISHEKRFSESRAKFYLCEILLALEDWHKRDIIFRDLKPDNVVIDEEGHAKLTDFGLSKEGVFDSKCAKSFCGSIAYWAPEMLKKQGHGKAVDWYWLGVWFYEMIVGIPPFLTERQDDIFRNIEHGELKIPKFVSPEATDLLRAVSGSNKDASEIKSHKYFKDVNWNDVYDKKIPTPLMNNYSSAANWFKTPKIIQSDDLEAEQHEGKNFWNGWTFIHNDES